jgi:heparosan-N-sulfate-glucuronate 5-epimerase
LLKVICLLFFFVVSTSVLQFQTYALSLGSEEPRYCIGKLRSDSRGASLDDQGIPITEYGYVAGVYIGPQRNPITVSQQALKSYDVFVHTNASYAYNNFLGNANWLSSHAQAYGNFSVFEYRFPLSYPPATIQPIWRSAMAQGLAIEVLSKAYSQTGDTRFIDSANKLLNAFYVEVDKGGVTHKTNDTGWWYELLANTQGIKPRILNGHLFALLGIYEYYNSTRDPSARYLFDQGIMSLKDNLQNFDYENGTYSYYDLSSPKKKLPSQDYHRLVVGQLLELYEITGDPIIKKYGEKWQNFELPEERYKSQTCRRTEQPPAPVFQPGDHAFRVGPSSDKITNGTYNTTGHLYEIDFPRPVSGLNLTSQVLNYHARNITFSPHDSEEIIFTLNIEEIHKPNVQIHVAFGTPLPISGWVNQYLYVINAGMNNSLVVRPLEILGEEYLQVRSMNAFLPKATTVNNATFEVIIG